LKGTSQKSFRILKRIKDPKFDIDRLEVYNLSLYLGNADFQILIVDAKFNKCLLLEDYVFDPELTDEEKTSTIKYIFDDHHLLLANFWKSISLVVKNKAYSFVPKTIFQRDKIDSYLKINTIFNPGLDEVMHTYHQHLGFVNVFSVPKTIVELTSKIYPGKKINFTHQSSALIDGVVSENKKGRKDIVIYVDRFGMHILIVAAKKLIFYNQYEIKKFDDYIKFINLVAKELNVNPKQDRITLYGFIGKNTQHFARLKKTLHQLTLGNRPGNLNFSYVFDEVLDHQYFDLFSTDTARA
jgi:hypothetical protein